MTTDRDNQFPLVVEGEIGGAAVQTVNARDLHAFLESGQEFRHWIKARIEQYGFLENQDFTTSESFIRGGKAVDYHVTIDMAKELAMVERTEKGKQARQYFLECERRVKENNVHFLVPKSLPEALRLAADLAEKVESQKAAIVEMTPKAEFHDKVAEAINCQTIQEVAKIIGTGQNRLFKQLRDGGVLMATNLPYQRFIDDGYFRVVERQYNDPRGESHTYTRTLVTGKGLAYIQRRFGSQAA